MKMRILRLMAATALVAALLPLPASAQTPPPVPTGDSVGGTTAGFDQIGPKSKSGPPALYLSFDDGPSCYDEVTWGLLDLLQQYGVTATWFVTGYGVNCDPAAFKAVLAHGHAVGSHTFNHDRLTDMTDAQRLATFTALQEVVDQHGGPQLTCYRPPYGATNDAVRASAAKLGYKEWLWSLDTSDWSDPGVGYIVDVLNQAQNGDVVLMHDGNINQQTLDALEIWLPANADKFDFRPLPGCAMDKPVICGGLPATIIGTSADDVLFGTSAVDVIWAGPGDDKVIGGKGDDVICGGDGLDLLRGGPGQDAIFGGDKADQIWGGHGPDVIWGNAGPDEIRAGRGGDLVRGGAGADYLRGNRHQDELRGGVGWDTIRGDRQSDLLRGGRGVDTIYGGLKADTVLGGPASDFLFGGNGPDIIRGYAGADDMRGGSGLDSCYGGAGYDQSWSCETTVSAN